MTYILALDQGTTSSRALLFDEQGRVAAMGQRELSQLYPQPGWVEHDPEEIWFSEWAAVQDCLRQIPGAAAAIGAIGIANQRETTIIWDRETGKPVHHAIVWQCRRTAADCADLRAQGYEPLFREKTGLVLDPYFSGTKVSWLLRHIPAIRERAEAGDVLFGTVDSWLVYQLTRGQRHVTDATNASRTLMYNIRTRDWDDELLAVLGIPRAMCPTVVDSAGIVGHTDARWFGREIPIAGIAGDQQAALFGQGCVNPGMAKNTYGTGSFVLMNVGGQPVDSSHGLLSTIAWSIAGQAAYALEGSIFATGAVVQWLRDELNLIGRAQESEAIARTVPDTGGVYLVPAFAGLGAPYWDPDARGTIVGMTRGTNRAHIVRAALESIAYQTRDVLESMQQDSGMPLDVLRVDGGATRNNFLMQFQADILGYPVERTRDPESTALGAALLAGMGAGIWDDPPRVAAGQNFDLPFVPSFGPDLREALYEGWKRAVARARS